MGCSESKINNITTVNRCKERKTYMKQSVSTHAAFASARFTYTAALKNAGVALSDYAQSELQSPDDLPHPPQSENNGILAWDFFIMLMEDVHGPSAALIDDKHTRTEKLAVRRKVVKNQSEHDGGGGVVKGGNSGRKAVAESGVEDMKNVNLLKVFRELDDGFVKASENAFEVSDIHEGNKLHHHSSFADNQGKIKHSTRVMRVLNGERFDFCSENKETLATLLDKMLAWEKRLYDQVKAGEKMKYEYQKKMALLNKHRKRGVCSDKLKQTEATVNHLHTTYIVEMQSIDSTISEINRLRDQHLYPKLVQIVEEMRQMWENMQKQHEQQLAIVQRLINIKISQLPKDTSDQNLKNIERIHRQVTIWGSEFGKLMLHQKEYIKSLYNWLKVNLICIDDNLQSQNPTIESLLRTWRDELEKLPEEEAKTAISSFAAVIVPIVQYHSDEIKMKERCDEIRREIKRKTRKFEEWCDKQIAKRVPSDEMDVDVMDDMDVIAEQQVVVDMLKIRLEEEEEVYRQHRVQVKDKSLVNLSAALPEVFTAMAEFSRACSRMYGSLKFHFSH